MELILLMGFYFQQSQRWSPKWSWILPQRPSRSCCWTKRGHKCQFHRGNHRWKTKQRGNYQWKTKQRGSRRWKTKHRGNHRWKTKQCCGSLQNPLGIVEKSFSFNKPGRWGLLFRSSNHSEELCGRKRASRKALFKGRMECCELWREGTEKNVGSGTVSIFYRFKLDFRAWRRLVWNRSYISFLFGNFEVHFGSRVPPNLVMNFTRFFYFKIILFPFQNSPEFSETLSFWPSESPEASFQSRSGEGPPRNPTMSFELQKSSKCGCNLPERSDRPSFGR